jgi:D-inositol-3-phosphate glycosyltransferase
MASTLERGRKVLLCGNGGSAADAQHFAGELVGHFKRDDRRPLPALSLTADSAILTALGNDVGYAEVFSTQVRAFGQSGDLLIGISTSGRSPNLVRAFHTAREMGLRRMALLGKDGGELAALADAPVVVPSWDTQHIQETHLVLLHLLCDLVEERMAPAEGAVRTEATPRPPRRSAAAVSRSVA